MRSPSRRIPNQTPGDLRQGLSSPGQSGYLRGSPAGPAETCTDYRTIMYARRFPTSFPQASHNVTLPTLQVPPNPPPQAAKKKNVPRQSSSPRQKTQKGLSPGMTLFCLSHKTRRGEERRGEVICPKPSGSRRTRTAWLVGGIWRDEWMDRQMDRWSSRIRSVVSSSLHLPILTFPRFSP